MLGLRVARDHLPRAKHAITDATLEHIFTIMSKFFDRLTSRTLESIVGVFEEQVLQVSKHGHLIRVIRVMRGLRVLKQFRN